MKFTSDQIDVYRRDGVVPIGNVLDEATVAEAKEHIEALRQRDLLDNPAESLGKKAFRLLMVSSFDEWFKSIVNNDNLLDAAESVLGPNVQYYQDNIFWKPPKQGAPSTWHQDNIWWDADPAQHGNHLDRSGRCGRLQRGCSLHSGQPDQSARGRARFRRPKGLQLQAPIR